MATEIAAAGRVARAKQRATRLTARDRVAVCVMVGIPLVFVVGLVWLPTLASVYLSFTSWDGIGGLDTINWVGTTNYDQIFSIYPPFWPALRHNLIWLAFLAVLPTTFGLDRKSTRLNSSHQIISYAVFCLKKKKTKLNKNKYYNTKNKPTTT